ncbi:MAG: glutamate racemase [Betaproteobacteria bacterium]|nr:glutamate racemase [Betaproteobacteria bacterium]
MRGYPIGVFDSGVGGLSVLREIRSALPAENLLYVADSGAAPYGERSREFILARAEAIVGFFVEQRVKAIVVACNTATAVAIQTLRSRHDIPIVAIEPALKPAAATTRSGVIGILATSQTLGSENFARLRTQFGQGVKFLPQAAPGLVEQVEKGDLQGEMTRALVAAYVEPLLAQNADTIVLGCTHYPFLLPVIRALVGPSICLIDPAVAVARELARRLDAGGLAAKLSVAGEERFWTSGVVQDVQAVIAKLWGREVSVDQLPCSPSRIL